MQVTDWRANWARSRAEPCDAERLRRALHWATFTVHTMVLTAERDYAHWASTGTLRSRSLGNMRTRALADVDAFCDRLQWRTFERLTVRDKIQTICNSVHGLGYAKVAFALTCAGLADIACLDVHALRRMLGRSTPRRWANAGQYLDDVRQAFGCVRGSGKRQWTAYEQWVPAFARSQHAGVFSIMIGGYGA